MEQYGSPRYCYCPMCGSSLSDREGDDRRIRQGCSSCGWTFYPHMAISVSAVFVQGGNVLLVKRGHEPCLGTWMFPSGFLEYGELPKEGLLREFYEETNLRASVGDLLGIYRSEDDPREPNHVAMFYSITDATGELVNDPTENEAVSWFPVDQLPPIALINHRLVAMTLIQPDR